jgi:hypothetical protein
MAARGRCNSFEEHQDLADCRTCIRSSAKHAVCGTLKKAPRCSAKHPISGAAHQIVPACGRTAFESKLIEGTTSPRFRAAALPRPKGRRVIGRNAHAAIVADRRARAVIAAEYRLPFAPRILQPAFSTVDRHRFGTPVSPCRVGGDFVIMVPFRCISRVRAKAVTIGPVISHARTSARAACC